MAELWIKMRDFLADEEGASAVEYAVLVALIIAVAIAIIAILGLQVNNAFSSFVSLFSDQTG